MSRSVLFVVVIVSIFVSSPLFAITDEEIFRAFSLNLTTPGARAIGMGGAFIGRADDATAAETNPAGLTILSRPEVSFEYRHRDARQVTTRINNLPVENLDASPHAVPGQVFTLANFNSSDSLNSIDNLGYVSYVHPFTNFTLGFSRHVLIDVDADMSGGLTSSPFHFIEPNSFIGNAQINDVNYEISAATKISEHISFGGTLKISDFSIKSDVRALEEIPNHPGEDFGDHFISQYDNDSVGVGINAGFLANVNSHLSIGGVYKYDPQFDLKTVVINTDSSNPAPVVTKVSFDVPDQLGVGISVNAAGFTVNMDVVRVFYSQLEDVQAGFSLFTHLLPFPKEQLVFKVDDGTDFHVGGEYLVRGDEAVIAFRGGYYRQSRNLFFFNSAPSANNFLAPIFGTDRPSPINHVTVGGGVTFQHVEFDIAGDFALENELLQESLLLNKSEVSHRGFELVVSSVVRF
jgi:long-chain fatty acid transport protein